MSKTVSPHRLHWNEENSFFHIFFEWVWKTLRRYPATSAVFYSASFAILSYSEHKPNNWVQSKINFLVDQQEPLLATVKRRKLAWSGYVTYHDNLSKTILKRILEGGSAGEMPKSGRICPCQNCSQGPPAEKTVRGSLLNRPCVSPSIQSVKGMNWTELNWIVPSLQDTSIGTAKACDYHWWFQRYEDDCYCVPGSLPGFCCCGHDQTESVFLRLDYYCMLTVLGLGYNQLTRRWLSWGKFFSYTAVLVVSTLSHCELFLAWSVTILVTWSLFGF